MAKEGSSKKGKQKDRRQVTEGVVQVGALGGQRSANGHKNKKVYVCRGRFGACLASRCRGVW